MDATRIRSALLSRVNDAVSVSPYGHGFLVTLPQAFYDDDLVTVFIERYEGGIRVTDQGTTAMRLTMADVDLDNPRIAESWRRSIATLGTRSLAGEDAVVSAWGEEGELGDLLFTVADAVLRIDQLRWLASEARPMRFGERVVKRVKDLVGEARYVTPNARLLQTSGRARTVTAAVGADGDEPVYVQAVSRKSPDTSLEHCYYIFAHAELPRERKLAVAAGTEDEWSSEQIGELGAITDVLFFDAPNIRRDLVSRLTSHATSG